MTEYQCNSATDFDGVALSITEYHRTGDTIGIDRWLPRVFILPNQRASLQTSPGSVECAKQNFRHASTSLKLFGHPVGYDFFKLKIVARAMPSRLASCAAVSFIWVQIKKSLADFAKGLNLEEPLGTSLMRNL